MWLSSDEEVNWVPNAEYGPRHQRCLEEIQPLRFTGDIGDTLFWHGRLLHSSGVNTGENVRMAAILDYGRPWPTSRVDWMYEMPDGGLTHNGMREYHEGGGGEITWDVEEKAQGICTGMGYHHDVLEIDDRHIPTDREDMWRSWNLGATRPSGDWVRVQPWMEKFNMLPGRKEGELPRPPIEVARIVSQGGAFRDGEWRV